MPLFPRLGKPLHFSHSFSGGKSTSEICLRQYKLCIHFAWHCNKGSRHKSLGLKLLAETFIGRKSVNTSGGSCYLEAQGLAVLLFCQSMPGLFVGAAVLFLW